MYLRGTFAASVQLYISFSQLPPASIMFSSSVGKAARIVEELVQDVFVGFLMKSLIARLFAFGKEGISSETSWLNFSDFLL